MVIILLGPPGSGKTTQARLLAERRHLPYLSTGAVARQLAGEPTPEGELVKQALSQGELAPTEILNKKLAQVLTDEKYTAGFVLDGWPRHFAQWPVLEEFLASRQMALDAVISITLPDEVGAGRLLLRAKQAKDRTDDTPETISRRQTIFHQKTEPVIKFLRKITKVIDIDGTATVDEVHQQIGKQISAL